MPEPEEQRVQQLVGHLFRHEAGKMAAVLTRLLGFGGLDLAEDIVQDTLLKAMSVWRFKGIPENPSAWLYTVAKRKAIDTLRQQQLHNLHHSEISVALKSEWTLAPTVNHLFLDNEIEDSQLRMIFACCHPSIPFEAQLALTLKTLCGLSVGEIANSFLTNEETITKRLYRAREKIREERISLEAPVPANLPGRLDAVLQSLYLLFNEGYNSSHPDQLIRHDLCAEAMRLCLLLVNNAMTRAPETSALLALMCFQASRADARLRDDGNIILLKDQDRSQWNKALIEKGKFYLEQAAEGERFTEYHIEAAIAGCHSRAASFAETAWDDIEHLYTLLLNMKDSPIIALNRAIAIRYSVSPAAGLEALLAINALSQHYLYHAALGDVYVELKEFEAARSCYALAKTLTPSMAEKKLLQLKIDTLTSTTV
ncbi:RNA polymerase sigma factor [Chryseolinea lacunae]|uniref:RNA polymerase sigma factor n=1 Tax=Chryseolinea lacunae TaxID=2801331 RepID=A0ABS1KVY0_9BACT|nr:sigma-70 family RNA polymerase sigma factor [Chryseolinea lacunae]MBL0743382.1 sigma-70 family RNA polymerase sigma factor [Chryseolinea lacunae]